MPVQQLLIGWQWRPGVVAGLLLLLAAYLWGWRRLVHYPALRPAAWRPPAGRLPRWRNAVFLLAIAALAATLLSPLHRLAGQAFTWRVSQQLLLAGLAPMLLVVADPAPALLAALPAGWRAGLLARLAPGRGWGTAVRAVTPAGVVYFLFAAIFWLWYDPTLHQAARQLPALRAVEQASLLGAGMLYWWHIAGVHPHWHRPLPPIPHILYTLLGALPIKLVGLVLMFSPVSSYDYSGAGQASGGVVVWLLGGLTYSTAAAYFLRRWLRGEDDKPPLPHTVWATDDNMRMPGR